MSPTRCRLRIPSIIHFSNSPGFRFLFLSTEANRQRTETRCDPRFPGGREEPGFYGYALTLSNAFVQITGSFPKELGKSVYSNPYYSNFLAEIQAFLAEITRQNFTRFRPFRLPKYRFTSDDHSINRFHRLVKAILGRDAYWNLASDRIG